MTLALGYDSIHTGSEDPCSCQDLVRLSMSPATTPRVSAGEMRQVGPRFEFTSGCLRLKERCTSEGEKCEWRARCAEVEDTGEGHRPDKIPRQQPVAILVWSRSGQYRCRSTTAIAFPRIRKQRSPLSERIASNGDGCQCQLREKSPSGSAGPLIVSNVMQHGCLLPVRQVCAGGTAIRRDYVLVLKCGRWVTVSAGKNLPRDGAAVRNEFGPVSTGCPDISELQPFYIVSIAAKKNWGIFHNFLLFSEGTAFRSSFSKNSGLFKLELLKVDSMLQRT